MVASAASSWFSIPFENARAAFYADKAYPQDLRKNYASIFDALRRIPGEEGAYYLFKGSSPIIARNYCLFSISVFIYDFLRDWFYITREGAFGGDMPRNMRVIV